MSYRSWNLTWSGSTELFQKIIIFFQSIMRYSLLDSKRDHVEQNAHNDVRFLFFQGI